MQSGLAGISTRRIYEQPELADNYQYQRHLDKSPAHYLQADVPAYHHIDTADTAIKSIARRFRAIVEDPGHQCSEDIPRKTTPCLARTGASPESSCEFGRRILLSRGSVLFRQVEPPLAFVLPQIGKIIGRSQIIRPLTIRIKKIWCKIAS